MLQKGFKIAIYTNAAQNRFESFEKLGVKIVNSVPPKPDRNGFIKAMKYFLKAQKLGYKIKKVNNTYQN